MNFTIMSLSMSSIFTISPLFVGQQRIFENFAVKKNFPLIFLNPDQLKVQTSVFSHSLGGFIYSNQNVNTKYQDTNYTIFNVPATISFINNLKELIYIRNCMFDQIKFPVSSSYITISQQKTFYITDCTFIRCKNKKSLFNIKSRATTFSHICCSDFSLESEDISNPEQAIFIISDIPENSFLKFIYSTITGDLAEHYAYSVFRFSGTGALRVQCINVTKFHTIIDNDRSIFHVISSKCFSMQMNTFTTLVSRTLFIFSVKDTSPWYVNMLNSHANSYNDSIIELQMDQHTEIHFENCLFSKHRFYPIPGSNDHKLFKKNGGKLYVKNCVFEHELNTLQDCFTENFNVVSNPTTLSLAHYVVEKICIGVKAENATGCNDESCPDEIGCDKSNFVFGEDDISYTQKHHVDIDGPTPSPSIQFSQSQDFSDSTEFTETGQFSSSFYFSNSIEFSGTKSFSKSDIFTDTKYFSDSTEFTKTGQFSSSFYFTNSIEFSGTKSFSKSDIFTDTSYFSDSFIFSNSDNLNESTNIFSKSNGFSKSHDFSKSCELTKSHDFSKSCEFTKSYVFTKSFIFSNSHSFLHERKVEIGVNAKSESVLGNGMTIGIGVVCAVVAVGIIIVIVILMKRKKNYNKSFDEDETNHEIETLEVRENTDNVTILSNPLASYLNQDDPFEHDFDE